MLGYALIIVAAAVGFGLMLGGAVTPYVGTIATMLR